MTESQPDVLGTTVAKDPELHCLQAESQMLEEIYLSDSSGDKPLKKLASKKQRNKLNTSNEKNEKESKEQQSAPTSKPKKQRTKKIILQDDNSDE